MKISIVGSRGFPYVYSGYETFVSEVAPRLAARGHSVTVHCHRHLFAERPAQVRGVDLVYVGGAKSKSLSQLTHSLSSTVRLALRPAERPDIVLFVNVANGLFGPLLRAAGLRTAINVDGLEWARPKWSGLGAHVFRFAARVATKWFDLLITDARAMADVYRAEFGAESEVIEYGANLWRSEEPSRIASLGLAHEGYFLIVGRLIPDNNVKLLVEGFVRSRSRRQLVVVGDVPYADAYADSVKAIKDERVRFVGYVKDQALLRELYCGAFAYVHGHEHGGTNPALLKALGAGCAVLALDTPFAREVLLEGTHGDFFAKSVEGVAAAIESSEQDEPRVALLRRTARDRITSYYNWDRIVDEYERVLESLRETGTRRGAS